jgi:predicted Rossmann fold flavoprotein
MMAAGRAAKKSNSVLLLEKNSTLGKKLLLTGGGRCNLTNNNINQQNMIALYKKSGHFLFSAFSQFGVKDTIDFFSSQALKTKEENEGRIFPVTDSAKSVLDALIEYMKKGSVEIKTNSEVAKILIDKKTNLFNITTKDKKEFTAKKCILSVGGKSYPETGSTGEGFLWLKSLGHKIIETGPAMVPVKITDEWAKKLSGLTLDDIKLTIFLNDKKQSAINGKLLFTHFGISGPTAISISKKVGELLKLGKVIIKIDLFPKTDASKLKSQLQDLLSTENNKKLKNTLSKIIPEALSSAILEITNINGEEKNNNVNSESRKKLISIIKAIPLEVSGLLSADRAMVSSGGVSPKEIDFKTMQSKLIPNLYLIGDIIDIEKPSGGYSLQLCWTTGFVAGNNI